MQKYADLELSLHKFHEGRYSVQFRFSLPNSEVDTSLGQDKPAWVDINPKDDVFDVDVIDPTAYGSALTEALFSDIDLKTAFGQARASASGQQLPLRLRLWISASAVELHRLRWELLRDPFDNSLLSTNQNVYFSRYFASPDWRPVYLHQKGVLGALLVVANPSDLNTLKLDPIDRESEFKRARSGMVGIELMALGEGTRRASLEEVSAALRTGSFDIIYLVCHGVMHNGQTMLFLEGKDGNHQYVSGEDFAQLFKDLAKPPRLVILMACQSAGNGGSEALTALGPRLVEAGVPAVIAMQANMSMESAALFLPPFCSELQQDGQIDRALAAGRSLIRHRPDFWAPVLFMRLKSGQLWYTPGFSNQKGNDYVTEIGYINRGSCTPIIGPGLLESYIGLNADIAREWAEAFHFPMSPWDRDALPKVAQYLSTDKGDAVPFMEYEEAVQRILRRNFRSEIPSMLAAKKWVQTDELIGAIGAERRKNDPLDPYRVLASLPFSHYICATPDRLLEDALEEAGRKPEVILCPWNDRLAQRKTIFELSPNYVPSPDHPLIFYFFGRWNERLSMVLTEDDYIRFLIGYIAHKGAIPEEVRSVFSENMQLFLGFHTEEWNFRILLQCILAQGGSELHAQNAHISAQLEPQDERTLDPVRARRYLETYFIKGANITVYWGQAQDYLAGLLENWKEHHYD